MRALVLAALGLAACVPEAVDAQWRPAGDREAPLAIESQPIPAAPSFGPSLRVVSYNVEFGADIDGLAAALSRPPLDTADVLLLQEIEDHPDEGGSRPARLAGALGMAHVYLPSRDDGGATHGIAILARRPIADIRYMDLPQLDTSLRTDGRVALAVDIGGVDVVNVHLRLQLGIAERIVQLAPATRDLAPVAIIGGDLNTNPYAWADMLPVAATEPITDIDAAAAIDQMMVEAGYDPVTSTSGPTHGSPAGELRLDSIYSRGLAAGAPSVERTVALSDHWPLWIDLAIAGLRSLPGNQPGRSP